MPHDGNNESQRFFSICVRRIVQAFFALFRFSEADVCALLSGYGFYVPEVDCLQNNRPNEQESVVLLPELDRIRSPIPKFTAIVG